MFTIRFHILLFLLPLIFVCGFRLEAQVPGLYINEVSQGASGSKEYVELVVVGAPSCNSITTIDLRGWYIDDNNGLHATGVGTGIAPGVIRFTQDPLWAAVPIGTIIVVYNDADLNASLPAQDISMADGNCRLVIPVSNCTLFEKHSSNPSTATSVYPTTGFTPCGLWTTVSMSNTDDSFQTVDPSGNVFHSVSWGNNTLNDIIYFAGTSGGMVAFMSNATNDNITTQANWVRLAVGGNETPGLPNNAANQAWICRMNNGCTPPTPISLTTSQINASCACTGSATVSGSGGYTGCGNSYSYNWAPSGGNGATASALCAGMYTVTVSDINGCIQTQTVNITAAAPFTISQSQNNVSCNGGTNGSATVSPNGGTGPFTYSWLPSGGNGATATGLTAGSYTVTITDAGACSGSATILITQPAALTASPSQTSISCNGGCNGTATVLVSGGTPGYNFSWSPSGGTSATASSLCATSYSCTITDGNGCITTQPFTFTQPPALAAIQSQVDLSCNGSCNGSAAMAISGGTGAYSYNWNPSPGAGQGTANATGLCSGLYTCTVTDANGCSISPSFTIVQPVALTASSTTVPSSCGGNNGSAIAIPSGGTAGYTYSWTPSGGNGATANGLVAGSYICTITDANNCTTTTTANVGNNGGPSATISSSANISCFGGNNGSLTANPSGGTPGYSYSWAPSGGTSATASGLIAGSYTCTISDSNGCLITASLTLTEPTAVTATQSQTNSTCNAACNGTAGVIASGGTPGFTYSWLPAGGSGATASSLCPGTYSCIITDVNGCNITQSFTLTEPVVLTASSTTTPSGCSVSNGSATVIPSGGTPGYSYSWAPAGGTNATASGLSAGSYTCTITDANTCTTTSTVIITSTPGPSAIVSTSTNVSCFGGNNGSATITASGGTPGYSYSWSPSGGTNANAGTLNAGTFTCTVTDSNGCIITQTVSITQPSAVTAGVSTSPDTCSLLTGMASVNPGGGTGPYTYLWMPGAGNSSAINGLSAGAYTITVTDSHGCSATGIANVGSVSLPSPVAQISANGSLTFCAGGSVQLTASGGNSYLWSTGASTPTITVNSAGTFTVVVSNPCGSDTQTVTTTINPVPIAQIISSGPVIFCAGGNDTLYASGGTSFLWSTGATGNFIVVTTQGNYTVIVNNGCGSDTANLTVFVDQVNADFYADVYSGTSPLPVNFTDNSSANAISWQWNFGDNTSGNASDPSHTFNTGGTFIVVLTVSDANGCTDTANSTIVVIENPSTLSVPNVFTPNADGTNDQFQISATGIDEYDLQIFDRWGKLLFESNSPQISWDGRVASGNLATDGTYYYILNATGLDQKSYNLSGFLTLLK